MICQILISFNTRLKIFLKTSSNQQFLPQQFSVDCVKSDLIKTIPQCFHYYFCLHSKICAKISLVIILIKSILFFILIIYTYSTSKNWKSSRLTILHAYQSHSGIYSCTVYNTSTAAAHVQVLNGN